MWSSGSGPPSGGGSRHGEGPPGPVPAPGALAVLQARLGGSAGSGRHTPSGWQTPGGAHMPRGAPGSGRHTPSGQRTPIARQYTPKILDRTGRGRCLPDYLGLAEVPLTLLIGALGGYVAELISIPLPWMIGSMASAFMAGALGLNPNSPRWLRLAMQTVVGTFIGAHFRPDIFQAVFHSAGTVASLLVLIVLETCVGTIFLVRVARYSGDTALLAAAPGGLNDMLLLCSELGQEGSNHSKVAPIHICRVLGIMATVPLLMPGSKGTLDESIEERAWRDWAILLACAMLGPKLAWCFSARYLVGPLLLSTGAHVFGITTATVPQRATHLVQCVLGTGLAARILSAGATPAEVVRILLTGLGTTALLLAVTLAFVAVTCCLFHTQVKWPLLLLAFSPGGLTEMHTITVEFGYDAAFVAMHHTLRISFLLLFLPLAAKSRRLKRRGSDAVVRLQRVPGE